jgi:hypothetical protein
MGQAVIVDKFEKSGKLPISCLLKETVIVRLQAQRRSFSTTNKLLTSNKPMRMMLQSRQHKTTLH